MESGLGRCSRGSRRRCRLPLALAMLAAPCRMNIIHNPTQGVPTFVKDFENFNLTGVCRFEDGILIRSQYAHDFVEFAGPGFGSLNGGVLLDACALSGGVYPPLGTNSFRGRGFVGFSTLHTFTGGRTGKAIAPETVRFALRMTNIRAYFAGIDGHSVRVELWSGPGTSYNNKGVLLLSREMQMSGVLRQFPFVNSADRMVDCVRRIEISSPAKMFVLDNFTYELSAASDAQCPDDPAIREAATAAALQVALEEVQTSVYQTSAAQASATAGHGAWASVALAVCIAAAVSRQARGAGAPRRACGLGADERRI